MSDKNEYRYHYIKINEVEMEKSILTKMNEIYEQENKMSLSMGNLLYATNNSLTGETGDSFYNTTFIEDIRYLSKLFPTVIFTAGWTNSEDKNDNYEFTIQNGLRIKEDNKMDIKIFGYKDNFGLYSDFGMNCGIVLANSIEEAKTILNYDDWNGKNLFEIPMEKGYHFIGDCSE